MKLELDYRVDSHSEGDTYQFKLKDVPEVLLTCLIIDAGQEIGRRNELHGVEVLTTLVAKYYEVAAAEIAESN